MIELCFSKNLIFQEEFGYVIRKGYMGGKPALLGKRIAVAQILEALSEGASHEDLIQAYELTDTQINEVLAFAAAVVEGTAKCG